MEGKGRGRKGIELGGGEWSVGDGKGKEEGGGGNGRCREVADVECKGGEGRGRRGEERREA